MEFLVEIVKEKISKERFMGIGLKGYGEMIKVAVDTENEILAIGGEFHADCLEKLIENNSNLQYIWGANIYLKKPREQRVEFIALINIRPTQNNRSMEIQNLETREKIRKIINKLIE